MVEEERMKRCYLCGAQIVGRSVKVWAQPITDDPRAATRTTYHDAHPSCARMLDDDEEETSAEDELAGELHT